MRKITTGEVQEAMAAPVRLVTVSGEDSRFCGVQKDIHFRPSTAMFIVSASDGRKSRGGSLSTKDIDEAVKYFNAIHLGKL